MDVYLHVIVPFEKYKRIGVDSVSDWSVFILEFFFYF